ncbi:MAG: MgtC/SapB family protein [Verrucomicrobia bacterium]|nr:MgtC/SapB family protein [Verrucomicrobiota bacterium]
MSPTIGWPEVALRLVLTVLAGGLIGLNRGEHGHPAGLRTTLLVCLAASITMLEVNLLLDTSGKAANSYIQLDLMRLPLGILTGMGFIGAGAIVRKEGLVLGLTTAAALWFVTVLGLCFGGGQLALGLASLALGLVVLWGLKWVEKRWKQDRHATLTLTVADTGEGPTEDEISARFKATGYKTDTWAITYDERRHERQFSIEVHWRASPDDPQPPPFLHSLARQPGVLNLEWKP